MGDLKQLTLWVFHCPVEYREAIQAALPGVLVGFPAANRSIMDQAHRIQAQDGHILGLWEGSAPVDYDIFSAQTGIAAVNIHPISLLNETLSPVTCIGFRVEPLENIADDHPLLSRIVATRQEGHQVLSSIPDGEQCIYGDDYLTRMLPPTQTSRPRLLVVPSAAWVAEHAHFGAVLVTRLCAAVAQAYGATSEVWLNCAHQDLDFIEPLRSGDIDVHIWDAFNPAWVSQVDMVLTNDLKVAAIVQAAGCSLHSELSLGRGDPFEDWDLIDIAALEPVPLPSPLDPYERWLGSCYYPHDTEYLGCRSVDATDGATRLEAFRQAIEARFGMIDWSEAGQGQEEETALEARPRLRRFVPDKTCLPAQSIHTERLTENYDIEIFDDRLRACKLTCILPFRSSPDRPDAAERLRFALMDREMPEEICFLVVDDGTAIQAARDTIRGICEETGHSYIYNNSAERDFSVGRCRNIGAEYARSRFIFMQDIDLMPYDGFYRDLLVEMDVQGMYDNGKHFLMVPCVYLTNHGAQVFLNTPGRMRRQKFIHAAITDDAQLVEKFSTGTSANVYNRLWYLARGGNRPDFEGWGYEDLECNARMLRHLKHFPIPADWAVEKYNFNSVTEYRTYKAVYRLFGDMMMQKGIALFHAWHPIVMQGDYQAKAALNRNLFIKTLQKPVSTGQEPNPLPDRSRGRSLVFRNNPFTLARQVRPLYGEIELLRRESELPNKATFSAFLKERGINRVVFFNPYETPHMHRLFEWARELEIERTVCERGALPKSSFFDPDGFLFDSKTYWPETWDKPLTVNEQRKTKAHIRQFFVNNAALETQSEAIGAEALRKGLGISNDEFMLFVPLQRPGDTVTRFFTETLSYPDFEEAVRALAHMDLPNVKVVIKTHPLEENVSNWGNAIIADNGNINDLLDACDLVWTFNSGVGVLAMLYERHVLYSGAAFYRAKGINTPVKSCSEIIKYLETPPSFDVERSHRFLHHLYERVYSFGDHDTRPVRMPDGSRMTATTDITYERLMFAGEAHPFVNRDKPLVGWNSILFDRYRYAGHPNAEKSDKRR